MQNDDANDLSEEQARARRLQRLADVLGCSPDDFGDVSVDARDIGETVEMLRLWLAIEDRGDRDLILGILRRLSGD